MFTLVTGGSASGKSSYAEDIITALPKKERIYIATMQVFGEEGLRRVKRHREMRAQKGFRTVECPSGLINADIPEGANVLLECLSNLAANECFGGVGMDRAADSILEGIDRIFSLADEFVIVTNEIFSDGLPYPEESRRYADVLAALNCAIAARADRVIEVINGIPVIWKE